MAGMYHRVFDRVSAVVGEQVWNSPILRPRKAYCALAVTRKGSHSRPQTEVGGFSAAKTLDWQNFGEKPQQGGKQ